MRLIKSVLDEIAKKDCKPLMFCIIGSRLYGTNDDTSDVDISGVFIPSKSRLLLNKVPSTIVKHLEDGTDLHLHSIYHFMSMLEAADPRAIEMLYIDKPDHLLYENPTWNILIKDRDNFLNAKIFNFMRFVRSQADKYGLKGERYAALNDAILTLSLVSHNPNTKLINFFDVLLNKNKFIYEVEKSPNGIRQINVCGKLLQETMSLDYAIGVLTRLIYQYGDRSIKAANMQGADYKALSHAIRVGEELVDLVEKGKLSFPSKNAQYLKDVKNGLIDYDSILSKLEELINKVDTLKLKTTLLQEVSKEVMNNITIRMVESCLNL